MAAVYFFSNDISQTRARALLKNIEMFGFSNAIVLSEAPEKLRPRFDCFFDKILIDAPCSGEGMFRKDPSIISNWEKNGTGYYSEIQKDLIVTGAHLLKPGGMLLYSTCTFSPDEDEEVIEHLLNECEDMELVNLPSFDGFDHGHPDFIASTNQELRKCIRLWPHKIKGEGHFLALLHKKDQTDITDQFKQLSKKKPKLSQECEDFLNQISPALDLNRIQIIENRIYYLPEQMPDTKGLRILRSGVLLGEEKKKRFEPSQQLAMVLNKNQFANCYSMNQQDPRVIKYLKGETIFLDESVLNGYVLIQVDGFSLGWGKSNRGMCKNKYTVSWRYL